MSNEMNGADGPASPRKASRRSSTASKLIQAAALAAVLVPLGSVAVETTTCTFTGGSGFGYGYGCSAGTEGRTRFDFGGAPFFFELSLGSIQHPVTVEINATDKTQAEFQSQLPINQFSDFATTLDTPPFTGAGYSCITLNGNFCEEFEVLVEAPGPSSWTTWRGLIGWDTPVFANDAPVTMLHAKGIRMGDGDNIYDEDMCVTFPDACFYDPDPRISSGDTDFQLLIAALGPAADIPEPASLVLVGTGVGAVVWSRRRRKRTLPE